MGLFDFDRFRIRIDSEKANLSRFGHSPDMGIPFRKARLEKSPIELATEDVKKSTALALHKGIPDSVNSLVDIETKSHCLSWRKIRQAKGRSGPIQCFTITLSNSLVRKSI